MQLDAIHWAALCAQAQQALPQGRLPLHLNAACIGSILPQDATLLAECHPAFAHHFEKCTLTGDAAHVNAGLAAMALLLKQAGRIKAWRDELLPILPLLSVAVPDREFSFATPLACVERAAARRLGILTHAVHLVGFSADQRIWLQQRAATKSTDPGLWDTLSGGLVAAGDTLYSGMLRETYEEAGLQASQLSHVRAHGARLVQKIVPEGVMIELAWTYSATLSPDAVPHNLDGEVCGFACLGADSVAAKIMAGEVTLEAALALGVVWGAI